MTESANKNKSEYWQIVRGVCILAVIMIHCPSGNNYTAVDSTVWLVLRSMINFPVALFVFMAGYFVNAEKVKKNTKLYYLTRGASLPLRRLDGNISDNQHCVRGRNLA